MKKRFKLEIMPGIQEFQSENPVQNASTAEPNVQPDVQSLETENEQPPRESDQTDKLNKFLLKSFLQHINNQSPPEPMEQNSNEPNDDWE